MLRLGIVLLVVLPASMVLLCCAPREGKAKAPPGSSQTGTGSRGRSPSLPGTSGSRDATVPITVAPVRLVKVDRTIPVVGTLFPRDEATLGAEVEGRVEVTMAELGDRVTNGQVIAQIDTATYEGLSRLAEANLARAKATALNASQNLKRTRELNKSSIASSSELDQAIAGAEQAASEVKAAEAAEAVAHLNLQRSRVRAPFEAAVAERIANAGDYMKVGAPLFRVVNDGVLKYMVQAPERYAGDVRKEQLVRFTVDAYPGETFEGRVYLISPAVNTITRSFAFGALVDNRERRLKSSSYARGDLILEKGVPVPTVPLDSVINFAGVTKVFVIESGVARVRAVQTGRIRDGLQEILSGLREGELVAISGQTKLFDGAKVRIKQSTDGNAT
ncbi:MAG TPA: efflux RND transporter periplasmic adaptor subunit [Verrucomicrobiae bacterium]|nr:efflux RND transporter periplasmic adaptor subunit [Verrucomicrobiae bacterium]